MTLENRDEIILDRIKQIFYLMQKIQESNYYDKWGANLEHEIKTVTQALQANAEYLKYSFKNDYAD